MGLSKQAQDAVQKGRVDAMSHMHADRHGHHTKKVTDKGLHEPLLGSSLVRSPDFSRSA